jgi:hypothetical protein
LRW